MTVTLRSESSLMMAGSKEAIVRRMMDALHRADLATMGELVSDDVVYHFPGRSPVAGTYRGRNAFDAWLGGGMTQKVNLSAGGLV